VAYATCELTRCVGLAVSEYGEQLLCLSEFCGEL
jgi:hypothetical protein